MRLPSGATVGTIRLEKKVKRNIRSLACYITGWSTKKLAKKSVREWMLTCKGVWRKIDEDINYRVGVNMILSSIFFAFSTDKSECVRTQFRVHVEKNRYFTSRYQNLSQPNNRLATKNVRIVRNNRLGNRVVVRNRDVNAGWSIWFMYGKWRANRPRIID